MSLSLQVLYPVSEGSTFDHDYYLSTHMSIVMENMGQHIENAMICKGLAGGPDIPSPFHVIATMTFKDKETLDAAMAAAGPALADIKNFYNKEPQMVIGEVAG